MDDQDAAVLQRVLRVMQIISFCLISGAVSVAVLMVVLRQNMQAGAAQPEPSIELIMTWMPVGLLAIMCVAAVIVPQLQVRAALQRIAKGSWLPPQGIATADNSDTWRLLMLKQTVQIMQFAFIEGSAMFGAIAHMVSGSPIPLVVTGVAVAIMLVRFPTESGVRSWIESKADLLAQLKSAS